MPVVVHVVDHEFQRDALEKLGRLEANVEMLVGDRQPGRMKITEDKIFALQRNDICGSVYDRIVLHTTSRKRLFGMGVSSQ